MPVRTARYWKGFGFWESHFQLLIITLQILKEFMVTVGMQLFYLLLQGAFPPPCGPESLFSLLDERSLLKYAKGTGLPEHGSPFRYFVLDNSIIIGLLEQPLGNYEGDFWCLFYFFFDKKLSISFKFSPRNCGWQKSIL